MESVPLVVDAQFTQSSIPLKRRETALLHYHPSSRTLSPQDRAKYHNRSGCYSPTCRIRNRKPFRKDLLGQRAVATIRVPIHPGPVPHGVSLQESSDLGVVVAGTVVVQARLFVELPAGEHEAVRVVRVAGPYPAIDIVLVDLDRVAAASSSRPPRCPGRRSDSSTCPRSCPPLRPWRSAHRCRGRRCTYAADCCWHRIPRCSGRRHRHSS